MGGGKSVFHQYGRGKGGNERQVVSACSEFFEEVGAEGRLDGDLCDEKTERGRKEGREKEEMSDVPPMPTTSSLRLAASERQRKEDSRRT